MSKPRCTDFGCNALARGERDQLDRCAHCRCLYDPRHEGHTDEATELSFCDATCEMHHFRQHPAPAGYVFAP